MKTPFVQAYLFFGGRCEEAIAFYTQALGARPGMLMRFDQAPDQPPPGMLAEGWQKKVMHTEFTVGETLIMASDGCNSGNPFSGFSLSLTLADETEAQRAFAALSEGGEVVMPLTKTFWSPCFGMLKDRFGVSWMLTIPQPPT